MRGEGRRLCRASDAQEGVPRGLAASFRCRGCVQQYPGRLVRRLRGPVAAPLPQARRKGQGQLQGCRVGGGEEEKGGG
jgi:hypothetical protein